MDDVPRNAWLEALNACRQDLADDRQALTSAELAELIGLARSTTLDRINLMIKRGQAKRTSKLELFNGRRRRVAAYLLVDGGSLMASTQAPTKPTSTRSLTAPRRKKR